jgi:hypothetical protein
LVPRLPFPANIEVILWTPGKLSGSADSSTVAESDVYFESETGAQIAVTLTELASHFPLTYEVRPLAPFTPGVEYTFRAPESCEQFEENRNFLPQEVAPAPTQLGILQLGSTGRERIYIRGDGGTCTDRLVATVASISVVLTPEAEPWQNVLLYTTKVNGNVWSVSDSLNSNYPIGSSWQGRGYDVLFASCESGKTGGGLAQGVHEVVFEARLPDSTLVLSTPPLMIELSCDVGLNPNPTSPQNKEDHMLAMNADAGPGSGSGGCTCVQRETSLASFALVFGVLALFFAHKKNG